MRETIHREMKQRIVPLTLVYTASLGAVLRANFLYKDDIGRQAEGYTRWYKSSRHLTDLLAPLLEGRPLADTSPLTQILALLLMAVAADVMLHLFSERLRGVWAAAAVFPLAVNPYFLECISFKFDAPFMALSAAASVIPLLWSSAAAKQRTENRKGMFVYVLTSVTGLLVMCMTYQASSGIYPILVTALAYERWNSAKWQIKQTLHFLVISAGAYVSALMIYRTCFVSQTPSYVSTSIWPISSIVPESLNHYKVLGTHYVNDLSRVQCFLVVIIITAYIISSLVASQRNRAVSLLCCIASLIFETLMLHGVYLIMQNTGFNVRTMYALGFWICTMQISMLARASTHTLYVVKAGRISVLLLSCSFLTFAMRYGNNLSLAQTFLQERSAMIADDLNELQLINNGKNYRVGFAGHEVYPLPLRRQLEESRMMRRLIPPAGTFKWREYYLLNYYGINNMKRSGKAVQKDMPVLKETSLYTIYGKGKYIKIYFKDA